MEQPPERHHSLPPSVETPLCPQLLWTLILTTVLAVGSVYYSQPLLVEISRSYSQTPAQVGAVPFVTQLGYVFGLFFLTPLGDVTEKRRLLTGLLIFAGCALAGCGLAANFALYLVMAFCVGMAAVLVQIIIPFVAVLSPPHRRGHNLGLILSAALLGILASRTLSGFIGALVGWRGMYYIGASVMVILAVVLRVALPKQNPQTHLGYPQLLHSVWELFRTLPKVRAIAFNGALMYAAVSAFWASLAFYVESPMYHLGSRTAGAFGLIGAVGAMAAGVTGRHSERIGPRKVVQMCIALMIVSFVVMGLSNGVMPFLIMGVIFLDLGAQAATVSNQTQLYSLHASAQTRLNTIYKMVYMAGGACGSAFSAIAWQHFGWLGVCGVGIVFLIAAWIWERFSPLTKDARAKQE